MGPLHTAQLREHRHASRVTVDRILHPRSVAILGASDNVAKFGGRITSFLVKHGYAGELFPISRSQREILGRRAYANIGALPSAPDVAILAVPGQTLQSALEEAEAAGVGCCVIISTGFAEADDDGAKRQAAIVEISARSGMRILGPNCMGLIVPHHRMALCSSVVLNTESLADGSIGLVSQSGALMVSMLDRARADGIGLRYGISCGNQSDLEICDFLDHMIGEQETSAICAYVEGFVDPERFRRSAIACRELDKPLLVLKTGRTPAGVVAARSHTASLAGSHQAFAALCREQGVLLPKSTDDMIWAAHLLTRHPGRRSVHGVAVLSSSGGSAGIASDRLGEEGLELAKLAPPTAAVLETMLLAPQARNPVDLGGRKVPENIEIGIEVTKALITDPNVGYGLLVFASMPSYTQRGLEIVNAALASGKPILTALTVGALADDARRELRAQDRFYFDGLEDAVRVLALITEFDRQPGIVEAPAKRPADLPSRPDFAHIVAGAQTETEVKALLALYGIVTAKEILAKTPESVGEAAEALGFPVVLKASSRDILHKSDVGAVRLGITDRGAAIDAAEEMLIHLRARCPVARILGFSVQETVRGEIEVIVGARRDPQFGALVIVGLGGTAVEIIGDVAVASAPISQSHVRKMIDSLATAALFKGARGKPLLDVDAIASVVERVSWLAYDLGPTLVDMEVNPLIVGAKGQGAVAVDARANFQSS